MRRWARSFCDATYLTPAIGRRAGAPRTFSRGHPALDRQALRCFRSHSNSLSSLRRYMINKPRLQVASNSPGLLIPALSVRPEIPHRIQGPTARQRVLIRDVFELERVGVSVV